MDGMSRMGVDSFGIDLRRRPPELASAICGLFDAKNAKNTDGIKEKIREMCGSITYGHYIKGLD